MTDKQIIVDEINKTIEQEMENLRNIAKQQIGKLEAKLQAKEQECEELKKNVEHWKMEHKEAKAKGEWTYDLVKKRLGQQLDQLKAENEKLEQTLTEIKEIAKNMNNECFYDDFDCKDCDMKNGCTYFNKSKVLQIIEEKGD